MESSSTSKIFFDFIMQVTPCFPENKNGFLLYIISIRQERVKPFSRKNKCKKNQKLAFKDLNLKSWTTLLILKGKICCIQNLKEKIPINQYPKPDCFIFGNIL